MIETWNPTPETNISISEIYTTHIENKIRYELGLPLRTHYTSDEKGYGIGEYLIKDGESLFYDKNEKTNFKRIYNKKTDIHILNKMNKLILSLTIIATCIQVNAQHPKVCDYISLKHALKNREFEVITAVSTSNACVELLHTKKEIKIPTIGLFGKEIDYHNIINYKNDTVYIHRRVCRIWNNEELIEIKNSKGAYRICEDEKTKISFEEFKIKENIEEECINSFPSIHLNLFEWEGIEKLFKDRGMAAGSEEYEELTRLVFENYKLLHADKWIFKPLGVPQK